MCEHHYVPMSHTWTDARGTFKETAKACTSCGIAKTVPLSR